MKLYFLKYKSNLETQGQSKGPFVYIRPDAPKGTLEHEEMHVLFWYIVTILSLVPTLYFFPWAAPLCLALETALTQFVRPYRVFKESIGYAREAAYKKDPEEYLARLERSRLHADKYGENFASKVRKIYNKYFQ